MKRIAYTAVGSANPLKKILAFIVTVAMIGLVLMFSIVALVVILVIGTIAGIYFWWKTRELRKQMRGFSPDGVVMSDEVADAEFTRGEVIEGEVIHVTDPQDTK